MVVGIGTAEGGTTDRIQPIRLSFSGTLCPSAIRKVTGKMETTWHTDQKIRIQTDDYIRLSKVINRLDGFAKGQLCPGVDIVPVDRFVLMPGRLRKRAQNRL